MSDDLTRRKAPGRAPTVLVVEDELLIRMAIAEHLQSCGFHVFEAGNAGEAITLLSQTEIPVDLVFTDVRMPGEMNGWGLAQWMHQNHPTTPVLVSSAEHKLAADELCNALPFLQKPYDFDNVASHIQGLLDKSGR